MKKKQKSEAPVVRLSNWPARLSEFVEGRRLMPFEWAKNDCCLFACDGILTVTGLDPAAKMFRGKYSDALGAARLLKKHGGVEAVAEKQCAKYGFAECPVPMARRGDLVSIALDKEFRTIATSPEPLVAHYALGICIGAKAIFPYPSGAQFVPVEHCRRAWRVG